VSRLMIAAPLIILAALVFARAIQPVATSLCTRPTLHPFPRMAEWLLQRSFGGK
jgi:hypothetical protein